MVDAVTLSSAIAAALRHTIQPAVLENLRADLVYADPQYSRAGSFDSASDELMWVAIPDLPINTTPLTEGTRPDKRALTMNTVTLTTAQMGDLVAITDLAKLLAPVDIVNQAVEHISRQAKESLDQISRDEIASGGTLMLANAVAGANVVRADLAATDVLSYADLSILKSKMFKAKIPPFADGFYRLFVSPEQEADLRRDASFIATYQYTDNTPLVRGEVGQIAGFRIITVVNAPTFASTTTVHAAIAVGAVKAWGSGELQSLSVYHVAPGGDHTDPLAQEELIGWKCMWGTAVLDNGYYFRLETGATAL